MKVVIAGAGIAGNVILRQLRHRRGMDVTAYESRSHAEASPPGLNVLMNHNGMAALSEMDSELSNSLTAMGLPMTNWSARTVCGRVLYHLPDVVQTGDASCPAMVARWDAIHQATRCDEHTEYSTAVVDVVPDGDTQVSVQLERLNEDGSSKGKEWIHKVDLLIAADGRYSTVRQRLAPTQTYFGPPFVADFRIVVHDMEDIDTYLTNETPMWRVYNQPNRAKILEHFGSSPAVVAAASGHVRVGIMKLADQCLGVFGNLAIPTDGSLSDEIKSPALLAALFEPAGSGTTPDQMGQMVMNMLQNHAQTAHWARKQETETCYQALDGRVLFLGDAAGAIYPSLGQGANLSLEDASVAAAAFPDVALIAKLRTPRREFIKQMSRQHAMHVQVPETYDQEIRNWADPSTQWRADLRQLWGCGQQFGLRAKVATVDNIQPFGQLVAESLDGDVFDAASTDADLDLSKGTPRFYLMKLTGGRPLLVDRMTRHVHVTQCLGALGVDQSFYLVMHAPSDHPTLAGLQAFCIPPRHFLKLHVGTWHVGPLWTGDDDARTFLNLELADTNQVDHDTVLFSSLPPFDKTDSVSSLQIPVMAVVP